ncbi:MAG: sodium-translocating pyrophosphatase [Hadesarchaea archaeon]|nr:sodium-translocating pyrophosphatase [Hadesarchaea archaeon]
MLSLEIFPLLAALAALAVAAISARAVLREDQGSPRVREIAAAIQEGASAFLRRQYTTIWVVIIIISLLLFFAPGWGWQASLIYIGGALSSTAAGFIGMSMAVRANSRTATAARSGISKALKVAFRGGLVMGMSVVGVGLLGVFLCFLWLGNPTLILPYSFGASTVALFARVGGGIFTKTADVGADLVGKVEKGIPEDDPRNPAVIADNVGDNVGDVAGMGADLFESYVASTVAAMIVGLVTYGSNGVLLPLLISALGIVASIISVPFVRVRKGKNPSYALNTATIVSVIVTAIFAILISSYIFGWGIGWNLFVAVLVGLISGLVVGLTSDYFTNNIRRPAQLIAESDQSGTAIGILTGFSFGLISTFLPIISIAAAAVIAFIAAGFYGICLAGVGMLAVTGIVVASDAYGPVADNAGGIVEQSGMPEKVRKVTDSLDSVGNTTKAICKGFAIGSAALTAVALFATYQEISKVSSLDLLNPSVMAGVFIGAGVVALFSALVILAVGRNAFKMVEEVRRQFREIPGLMKGKAKPDYARCVDIATKGALKELMVPGVLALLMPIVVGLVLGKAALGGFLAGSIITGLIFGLLMANAGGAWDNAKKYVEMGHFGGKGTPTHAAAVVGDTVGDPFKDTAGPSLNILIKLMSMVALIAVPMLLM